MYPIPPKSATLVDTSLKKPNPISAVDWAGPVSSVSQMLALNHPPSPKSKFAKVRVHQLVFWCCCELLVGVRSVEPIIGVTTILNRSSKFSVKEKVPSSS